MSLHFSVFKTNIASGKWTADFKNIVRYFHNCPSSTLTVFAGLFIDKAVKALKSILYRVMTPGRERDGR